MQNKTAVIGIAGTSKNTGKTTTLNCLLKEAAGRNLPIAVTGIGFDGEELDNVTFLPKPRITVYPNSIVTTSEQCLDISSARVEILHRTGMFTSLGEILILRVVQTGLIVIAGPGKRAELQIIIEKLKPFSLRYIFVDGSLNRIAPMAAVDSIIFTTGASRSTDISVLSAEMNAIEYIFRLPSTAEILNSKTFTSPLLMDAGDAEALVSRWKKEHSALHISKLISLPALERFSSVCAPRSFPIKNLIFSNPFVLLMNGDILRTRTAIHRIIDSGLAVMYLNAPNLACITANPFFPHYIANQYYSNYIAKAELTEQLQKSCSTPVFNTQETDPAALFDVCVSPHHPIG